MKQFPNIGLQEVTTAQWKVGDDPAVSHGCEARRPSLHMGVLT